MEIEQLATQYGEDAIDRIVVSELFSPLDCSGINSNAYELNYGEDEDSVSSYTLHFEKFMAEWAPFVDDSDDDILAIEEGEEAPSSPPYALAQYLANHVYDEFADDTDVSTYHSATVDGLREVADAYRQHVGMEPEVFVVDDDLLDEDVITGIEAIEEITIYESEYLDLGEEILASTNQMGYYATRTPIDASGYHMSEDDMATKEEPYVVQFYTRKDVVKLEPSHCMIFRPISPNRNI
jgi:hypothetical protein